MSPAEIIAASKLVAGIRYKAYVEYLEFSWSRKHPKATEYEVKGVEVEEKGAWYIFHFADGLKKRKRRDSVGTSVYRKGRW